MSVISLLTQFHSSVPPKVWATIYHRCSSRWHLSNHLLPRGSISAGSCDFKDGDPLCLGVWFLEMSPDQSADSCRQLLSTFLVEGFWWKAFHQNYHFGLCILFKDSFSKYPWALDQWTLTGNWTTMGCLTPCMLSLEISQVIMLATWARSQEALSKPGCMRAILAPSHYDFWIPGSSSTRTGWW